MFVQELTKEAYAFTVQSKRKTLQPRDLGTRIISLSDDVHAVVLCRIFCILFVLMCSIHTGVTNVFFFKKLVWIFFCKWVTGILYLLLLSVGQFVLKCGSTVHKRCSSNFKMCTGQLKVLCCCTGKL